MRQNPMRIKEDGEECVHHWLIDASNLGVCKKCGVSKRFLSSWGAAQISWNTKTGKAHHVPPSTKS